MTSSIKVNYTGPDNANVLIIGEAPGSDETRMQQPFVGQSGELLRRLLYNNGFHCASAEELNEAHRNSGSTVSRAIDNRYNIKFANLVNYQPEGNKFENFTELEVRNGVREIHEFIERHKSTLKIVILTGAKPVEYLLGKYGIQNWRGSALYKEGVLYFCTLHPAFILRNRRLYPILNFDLQKAFRYYKNGYSLPKADFTINPQGFQLEEAIQECKEAKHASVDIETVKYTNRILCIGVGLSKSRAICVTNTSTTGLDSNIRRFCAEVLEGDGPDIIEQTYHNGLFDVEVLHNNGVEITLNKFKHDTMVMQHVLAPEFDKGLSDITSIYTDIPYYKDKGKMTIPENEKGWADTKNLDKMTLYEYNCWDCVSTEWCKDEMLKEIEEDDCFSYIYPQEMSMHEPAFELMRNGVLIDKERNAKLNEIASAEFIKNQQLLNFVAGWSISAQSWQQKRKLLYDQWKLPVQKNRKGEITTDDDAIVALIGHVKDHLNNLSSKKSIEEWQFKLAGLLTIQKSQGYAKLIGSYLDIKYHEDGRARSVYHIAGPETARWSCSKYIDDTGWNAQTLPRESLEEVA